MSQLAYRSQQAFSKANPIDEATNLFNEYAKEYGSNITLDAALRMCRGMSEYSDTDYKAATRRAVESLQTMEFAAKSVARQLNTPNAKNKAALLAGIGAQLWACLR